MRNFLLSFLLICHLGIYASGIDRQTLSALEHIRNGYVEYGFKELKTAASHNDVAAQFYMAVCFENGIYVKQDNKEAFAWYRRAAERGLPDAMAQLAHFGFYAGHLSHAKSQEWLKRFENKGGVMTLPDLCKIYNEGMSYPANFALNPNETTQNKILYSEASDHTPVHNPASASITNIIIQKTPDNIIAGNDGNSGKPAGESRVARSDVDEGIPVNEPDNENTFVWIIANENYHDVANVSYALNDGAIFAEYCRSVLGIPDSNVHLVKDATYNNIKRELNLVRQIAEAYKGNASVIIYYAGHGIPDESTRTAYLLPVDGYQTDITTCYSLNEIYAVLGSIPASKVIVLLDACFSGSTRGESMMASARGIAIKPKPFIPKGNMIVVSATQDDETAYPFDQGSHGMFTYFLLKKLKESNGDVGLHELVSYIQDNVVKKSLIVYGKQQTPSVIVSPAMKDRWQDLRLKGHSPASGITN